MKNCEQCFYTTKCILKRFTIFNKKKKKKKKMSSFCIGMDDLGIKNNVNISVFKLFVRMLNMMLIYQLHYTNDIPDLHYIWFQKCYKLFVFVVPYFTTNSEHSRFRFKRKFHWNKRYNINGDNLALTSS